MTCGRQKIYKRKQNSLKIVVALGNILQGSTGGGGFPGAQEPSTSRILCQGTRSLHCLDPQKANVMEP